MGTVDWGAVLSGAGAFAQSRGRRLQQESADAMAGQEAKRKAEAAQFAMALQQAQAAKVRKETELLGQPKPVEPKPYRPMSREQMLADKEAEAKIAARHRSEPTPSYSFPTVTGPDGSPIVARADNKSGRIEATNFKAPAGGIGRAAIQKAVAQNKTTLGMIDKALAEIDRRPASIGPKRVVGDLPLVGGLGDMLNQHMDPEGVAGRALVSNIGSQIIHDRSGAAVSIHEFPRLAPFVPRSGDTPEAARTKLRQMRAAIEQETGFLGGGDTAPAAHAEPDTDGDEFSDDELVAAYTAGKRTDAEIARWIRAQRAGRR